MPMSKATQNALKQRGKSRADKLRKASEEARKKRLKKTNPNRYK